MLYNYNKYFKIYLILFDCYQIVKKRIFDIYYYIFIYDTRSDFQKRFKNFRIN